MSGLFDSVGSKISDVTSSISQAITSISDALGIKDFLDTTFRGQEIVNAGAGFSRLYSVKLNMPVVKQIAISALLGNRNPTDDLISTIQRSPARNLEKAYAYAISQQSSETYAYSASYIAARNLYSQDTLNYTNSVNAIKNAVVFTVVKSMNNPAVTYTGYNNLLTALNASDVGTKFPTIATEVLPSTSPKTYTYNYQKQNALNTLAQADAQINTIPKPTFNPPTQLGYYYYRLPTIESSGLLTTSIEAYPIIVIKREGGYATVGSDEYNTTKKLCKLYGFDYDVLKNNILGIDTSDLKAAGVVLGVDMYSDTEAAKKYIAEFFDSVLPYGTIQPIEVVSYETTSPPPFGEGGSTTDPVVSQINPYIKTLESSINLFVSMETATKTVINTSDLTLLHQLSAIPIVNVVMRNTHGSYNISIKKYINESSYLSIEIVGFILQTYVATDTSYHGTMLGMFTFSSPVVVATDHTDPMILPLLRAPYLRLGTIDRIDLSRESGFMIAMSAQVVALTWAQTNAGLIQFIAIVFDIITMGESSAEAAEITAVTTTTEGLVTTTIVYSAAAFLMNFAANVVIMLAVKELVSRMFPDNEALQLAATAFTMYYINDYDFSNSNSLEDVFNDRSFIDNMLKYSQIIIDIHNENSQKNIKKDSERYTAELNELSEEYKENAAELEALPQLTDLIREDYKNSALLRNRVKPAETVDMFYTRTLNTNLAEVSTNPTYYYNSKLNLNNIA
jgi:hypothetical protein